MIRICLSQDEARRLEQVFRDETDPPFRDRLPRVRLAGRDRPHPESAHDLALTLRTVQRWRNAYLGKW